MAIETERSAAGQDPAALAAARPRRRGETAGGTGRALGSDGAPRRPAARRRRRADAVERDAARRRRRDGDRARAHHDRRRARTGRGRRARTRHPGHAAHERHDAHRHQRCSAASRSCSGRSRSRGSPTGCRECASCGSRRSGGRLATALNGPRRQPVPAVLDPHRCRLRPGLLGAGVRVAADRHVPDPGAGAHLLAVLDGDSRSDCSSGRSSPDAIADAAGGDRGLAVDVHRARGIPPSCSRSSSFIVAPGTGAADSYEQELVLGEALAPSTTQTELPVSMSTAYARMKKIKTFYFICTGIGVLGFALVAVPMPARPAARRQLRLRRVHPRLDAVAHGASRR